MRDLLEKEGYDVCETYLYDVESHPVVPVWEEFAGLLAAGNIYGVVFTSASSVRAFFDIMGRITGNVSLENVRVVSIGPFTSEELRRFGVTYHTSEVHTVAGSLDVLQVR